MSPFSPHLFNYAAQVLGLIRKPRHETSQVQKPADQDQNRRYAHYGAGAAQNPGPKSPPTAELIPDLPQGLVDLIQFPVRVGIGHVS
ncbi:MAG: hypothetical protein UY99_C0001G0008 [Parcubacteria group bacterium GW2011_GWA1_59_11]|nr:MAG: hypothetical protein UY99_C0001G0008 [Parcubacteria group bacterium GW2011_GWA1_59_11]